jgi:hypothetical protein
MLEIPDIPQSRRALDRILLLGALIHILNTAHFVNTLEAGLTPT